MKDIEKNSKTLALYETLFSGTITPRTYNFIGNMLYATKTTESWRGRRDLSITIFKEEKEALNAMVFFILLIEKKVNEGVDVNFDACIAHVIKRVIRKALTWDAKPANKADLCKKVENYLEREKEYVREKTIKGVSKEFADALDSIEKDMSEEERNLYSVAKHFTNWVEFMHIKKTIFRADRREIQRQLRRKLRQHKVSKHISYKLSKLVFRLSWARNIVRWQGCGPTLNCNILCHMFETAIFGWLMAIEKNLRTAKLGGNRKFLPSRVFLIGLYHDFSEVWTDDIPSSCKREIKNSKNISKKEDFVAEIDGTIRPATEEQEREALAKHFYPTFSKEVAEYFRENVMLEDIDDEELRHFIKMADYFSADFECIWFIKQGSRNKLFFKIVYGSSNNKKERTGGSRIFLKQAINKIERREFF